MCDGSIERLGGIDVYESEGAMGDIRPSWVSFVFLLVFYDYFIGAFISIFFAV